MLGTNTVFGLETTPERRSNEKGDISGTSKRRCPYTYCIMITCLYSRSSSIYQHSKKAVFRNISMPASNNRYLPLKAQSHGSGPPYRPPFLPLQCRSPLNCPIGPTDSCRWEPLPPEWIFIIECIVILICLLFCSNGSPPTETDAP